MVKPSPALFARLRFTSKGVARGFYRGNRAGAMGAHTEYGKYVIDWRKTTHYNVPDTREFTLSPFVTQEMEQTRRFEEKPDGTLYTPEKVDGVEFLRTWKRLNAYEHDDIIEQQAQARAEAETEADPAEAGEEIQDDRELPQQKQEESINYRPSYTRSIDNDQDPSQQQQEQATSSSSPKAWTEMSRSERKEITNEATTQQLRRLKKETGEKVTRKQKKDMKKAVKAAKKASMGESIPNLRQDLIDQGEKDIRTQKQDIRGATETAQRVSTEDLISSLRHALIDQGVFQDQKACEKLLTDEGRDRKRAGLPKRTKEEKIEFLQQYLRNNGNA